MSAAFSTTRIGVRLLAIAILAFALALWSGAGALGGTSFDVDGFRLR